MLKTIKDIINERMALQEDASIILENDELDESIILTEDTDEPESDDDDKSEDDKSEVNNGTPEEDSDKDEDQKDPDEGTEEVPPEEGPIEEPNEEPKEEPVDVSIKDDTAELPEPEVKVDDNESILSMEIDLSTNTMKDTLPTPPATASDALADDDIMTQRVDDGFGDDGTVPAEEPITDGTEEPAENLEVPTGESTEEPTTESTEDFLDGFDLLSEAIDTGDEAPDADNAEENSVTKAVKDKVAEAEEPVEEPTEDLPVEDPGTEEQPPEATTVDKRELFDKLASLTNGIEDVKKQIVNSMN